ncbi:MAG: hypothetical protein GXP41_06455 [Chloroflexi bacterium]|nr:hypothetical protein [Chloroflexota bacterium]
MKKRRLSVFVAALGLLGVLLVVPVKGWARQIPAGTSALTAGPHLSSEITVSAHDDEQYLPSVAYNWKHREYLVVWHDKWVIGTRDIRAVRISEQGQVLSEFTVYEHPTKDSAQPAVGYDPVNDRYLVVWVFDTFGNGSDWDLYGRFIPWDGPSTGLTAFAISTWSTHQWNPRVAYGRAVEEFLVVWANQYQAGTPPMYISGRRVKADGSGFPGGASDLTINNLTQNRVNPDVAYNLARNEYLVVYDNAVDIFGYRVTGNLSKNFGGEFGIAGWPAAEIHPAVAACPEADQYLVSWQSDQSASNDAIYARFIGGNGTLAGVHLIDDTTSPERESDVACSLAGTEYLVTWQTRYTNLKYGVWGRLVQPDETMGASFPIVHPGPATDRTNPISAGGHTNYFVVWEHDRDGTAYQDIHGRLVTPHAALIPLIRRNYQ